ncbi:M23 family metallopeptidase [Nanchangia anserum]|uniref:M23 family metallopeptidase n=2 Tax=Nanchangia anserum TaxID=2692125 RepID=A0A8I0KN71_9ACTO|nr:M23 family metallopeptidase [Nanchangia anserum]QOX81227.1 M23 family metallopeptidase [Nanchangia anserum]
MMTIEAICRELGGSRFVLGNHITIDHGDGSFAVYAHLKEGSLNVQLGEQVEAGTVIASVGNTGNTSEPHLHFQLMDRANPSAAAGVPFQWPDAELTTSFDERFTTRKATNRVLEGIPENGQVFVSE